MIPFIIIVFIVILILVSIRPSEVISRWHHYFDQVQFLSDECYKSMEESIAKRKIPSERFRKNFSEGGMASANREYLRVTNGIYSFDICAAPYGTGFFVSWWLRESTGIVEILLARWFPSTGRKTYYQLDRQTMFRESVHRAVIETIDAMTNDRGVRGLTELERQITTNPKFNFQVKGVEL